MLPSLLRCELRLHCLEVENEDALVSMRGTLTELLILLVVVSVEGPALRRSSLTKAHIDAVLTCARMIGRSG